MYHARSPGGKSLTVFLLFLLLILSAGHVAAQGLPAPADSPEAQEQESVNMALLYYDRCMNTLFKQESDKSRRNFCGCTGDAARKVLSPEKMKLLATGVGTNIEIDKKVMFIDIYGPCMHEILKSFEFEECRRDSTNEHFFKTSGALDDMCRCMTDGVTKFIEQYGRDLMAVIMERQPKVEDPLQAMRGWNDYREERNVWRKQCLSKFAYH